MVSCVDKARQLNESKHTGPGGAVSVKEVRKPDALEPGSE